MDLTTARTGKCLRTSALVAATALFVALSLAGVALSADIPIATIGVGDSPAAIAVNPISHKVYVANFYGDTVSVIDGATDSNVATIPMPGVPSIPVPNAVVVNAISTPARAYVANWQSHKISFIDESTLTKTATITVPASNGSGNPRSLALWATSTPPKLYVANYHRNSVSVLNAETGATIAEIPVGASPRTLAMFTADSRKRLYVANRYSDNVSIIDMQTDSVVATAATGAAPKAFAVDQATGKVYVTNYGAGQVTIIDRNLGVTTCAVGLNPYALAVDEGASPHKVYCANWGDDTVTVIDEPVVVGTRFGPRLAMAGESSGGGSVAATVTPLPSNATTSRTPTIIGTASSTRAPYRTDIAAVFVRIGGTGSPLQRAEITAGAGTPDVSWRITPASPLTLGVQQVTAVIFDEASASAASSGQDQSGQSSGPAGQTNYLFEVREAAGSIAGTITAGSLPQSGIVVSAFSATTDTFVKGAFTSVAGAYSLEGLAAGSYHLRFTNTTPAALSQYYDHKAAISDATTITLALSEAKVASTDLTLITPPTISGISPASGPVGALVTITGTSFTLASTVTFNGTSVIAPVFDSSTQIRAEAPAGATSGKVRVTTSDGVATSPTNYTVTTAPTQVITGTITNAASPLSGIVVSAFDATTDTFVKGVFTNGSGVYSITGLAPGTYHLRFTGTTPASLSQYYDHKVAISEATTLTLVAATNLTVNSDLAPVVPPAVSTITGTISSDAGPMGGVLVSAFDATTNTFIKGVFANASGVYTMVLPAGSYHIRFTATTPSNLSQYYDHQGSIARAAAVYVAPAEVTTRSSNLSGPIAP